MKMKMSSTCIVAISVLLLINPSWADADFDLEGGLPSDVDGFDKEKFEKQWISSLFVFGDSLVDSGNNNFLPTMAKANYPPYGSTFFHNATGRFTDGRTAADFIAQLNGLPYPPPYLGLKTESKPYPKTGVNFASGSSGILPDTGSIAIQSFEEVKKELKKELKNEAKVSQHLSKALFYISAGSNDFALQFYNPTSPLAKKFTQETFPPFLVQELTLRLKKLYTLGARKFFLNNIGAVGCIPSMINTFKPSSPCFDPMNGPVYVFNVVLPEALAKLKAELPGSKFAVSNIFKLFLDIKASPAAFEISDTRNSCCEDAAGNGTSPCKPMAPPCKDVKGHFFFDPFHPTQSVHYLLVRRCFTDSTFCAPMNLSQLMRA